MNTNKVGYEFYVVAVKRSNGEVYADLAKTDHRIYFTREEAEQAILNHTNYQVIKMIAYISFDEKC